MAEPRLHAQQREAVTRRARGCCEYCLSQELYSPDPFSVEHIIPLARGGTHDLEGLDHGIGHLILFEVDSEARVPAPLMPKSP